MKRIKRRYLALKIVSEQTIDQKALMDAVWGAVTRLFGEYGASKVNLNLIEYDAQRNCAVLFCSHKALDMLRAAVAFITEINGTPVAIQVAAVSGTLKSLRKKSCL